MSEINWTLIQELHGKPHPLLNIADDFEAQIRETPIAWTGEVFQQARTAHHLLDLAGIAQRDPGHVYASDLDARTWLLLDQVIVLRDRLDRVKSWHSRETADGGMVGDFCNECGNSWPCDTARMADGSYVDETDARATQVGGGE